MSTLKNIPVVPSNKKQKIETKILLGFFFVLAALWFIMVYYTVTPWIFGVELQMESELDISYITWFSVSLGMISTLLWFSIQTIYLFTGNKIERQQRKLIKNKRYSKFPLVSILIPAKNEENVIQKTIAGCLAQSYKNFEVIVLCHNCTDDTFPKAQSEDKRIRPIDLKTKESGKGVALNHGVEISKGEYIMILDSDGILNKNFIKNALPLFDEGYAAVQAKICSSNPDYNIQTKMLSLEGDMFSTPFMAVRHLLDKRTPLGGTGSIIKKDALAKIGGFANALIEDFELSFRFYRNKFRIGFASLSEVYDEKPGDLALMFRQRSRWVKGHFDLLHQRIPEKKDIMGIIYWLSPIFMLSGFFSILVTSTAILYYVLFGVFPYKFTFVPIQLWFVVTTTSYSLQFIILLRQFGIKKIKHAAHIFLLSGFAHYWYVCLIKSFFVKSWDSTKTTHGFSKELVEKVATGENKPKENLKTSIKTKVPAAS
ncbi:MAG: glycosyltransferase [Nitrosopumilaceae archaeon]